MITRLIIVIFFLNLFLPIFAMQKEDVCKNKKITKEDLTQLRKSLDTLISMQSTVSTTELGKNPHFLKGSTLYEQAKRSFIIDPTKLDTIEKIYKTTENTYLDALECYIHAYDQKPFEVFGQIYRTITTILDLESLRQDIETDSYSINPKLVRLHETIVRIKEQEKERQNQISNLLLKANTLVNNARNMQTAIISDNEQNYTTIQNLYIQAVNLLFQAHEKNETKALNQAETVVNECIGFSASRKLGSTIYTLPESVNTLNQKLEEYKKEEHKKKNNHLLLHKEVTI